MNFKIIYIVKKEKRESFIRASSLEEAEEKANKKHKNWTDIYIVKKENEND